MRKLFALIAVGLGVFTLAACEGSDEDTLVVGLECNYAPFNWTDMEEGEDIEEAPAYCDGYDVEVARRVADDLGRELVIRKVSWDGLIPALTSNTIDVIIAGMSPTPERAETVNFTDEYYRSEQVLVVRSDSDYTEATGLDDFDGARVIAQKGTLQDDLIDQIEGVDHADPLDDYPSLVEQVESGTSDALVAELPVATSITSDNDNLSIVELENGFEVEESDVTVSIALRQEDTQLRDDINAILATIDQDTRNTWMEEALNRQP
ncbi:MAG: transporter substrate-binding domain-containing protein [Bacillota bacterium]